MVHIQVETIIQLKSKPKPRLRERLRDKRQEMYFTSNTYFLSPSYLSNKSTIYILANLKIGFVLLLLTMANDSVLFRVPEIRNASTLVVLVFERDEHGRDIADDRLLIVPNHDHCAGSPSRIREM